MSEMREPVGVPEWTLGWRLKRALGQAGMKAEAMADYLGYSKAQISRYLNDKGEPPRIQTLRQWAMATGVPLEWLQHGTEARRSGPDGDGEQGTAVSRWKRRYSGQVSVLRDLAATG